MTPDGCFAVRDGEASTMRMDAATEQTNESGSSQPAADLSRADADAGPDAIASTSADEAVATAPDGATAAPPARAAAVDPYGLSAAIPCEKAADDSYGGADARVAAVTDGRSTMRPDATEAV